MTIKSTTHTTIKKISPIAFTLSTPVLAHVKPLRKSFIEIMKKHIQATKAPIIKSVPRPIGVTEDLKEFSNVIAETADRILRYKPSPAYIRNITDIVVEGLLIEGNQKGPIKQFNETFHTNPPFFLTISPGKKCNLNCTGCYANSGSHEESLDWHILDRTITEAKSLWGVQFIVISGGEPMAYRSEGKNLLDIVEKHSDVFFLMFTNGTLINKAVAKRMSELGNITPAISVEGWRQLTDQRRGEGTFDRVLNAMKNLRHSGVPFGISLTATRENAEEILSDDFLDFFYEEQKALYGWIFHYMPIGRAFILDLMPTPEQRVWMWKRAWEIIHQRHIFLADFWNHGTLSDGCIAAGRSDGGGYLYIDWNGAVSPCVFVPFSPVNINEIYASGKNLNHVWQEPFFKSIRDWQLNYRQQEGNLLAPCINRDHHADLRVLLNRFEPDPIDECAQKSLLDAEYADGLEAYGKAYQGLSNTFWKEYYLDPQPPTDKHFRPSPEEHGES